MELMNRCKVFDFQSMDTSKLDDDFTSFIKALKLITDGKDQNAEIILRNLYKNSDHTDIRNSSATLLFDIYFSQSNWGKIERSGLTNDPNIEVNDRVIASALSHTDKTNFSFSSDSIKSAISLSVSGSPIINVKINGKQKSFWLDTGAGMTVISASVAKDCNIRILEESNIEVGNSINENIKTDLTVIETMSIQNLTIYHQPALVLSDDKLTIMNPRTHDEIIIDGIIGWDIIRNLVIEINYQTKQVVIGEPKIENGKEKNLFFCGYPIVKLKGESGNPLFFGLDTGANKTYFGESILSKLNHLEMKKSTTNAGGIGGFKEIQVDIIQEIIVYMQDNRPLTLQNIRMGLTEYATFFKLDGVLGSDISKNGSLMIDYNNRYIGFV